MTLKWTVKEKEEFYKLFDKLNSILNDSERKVWNKYRLVSFDTMYQIRDISHYPNARNVGPGNLPELSNKLYDIAIMLPILEK